METLRYPCSLVRLDEIMKAIERKDKKKAKSLLKKCGECTQCSARSDLYAFLGEDFMSEKANIEYIVDVYEQARL